MGLLEKHLTSDLQFEKYGEQGGGSKKQRKGNIGRADHLRVRVRSSSIMNIQDHVQHVPASIFATYDDVSRYPVTVNEG